MICWSGKEIEWIDNSVSIKSASLAAFTCKYITELTMCLIDDDNLTLEADAQGFPCVLLQKKIIGQADELKLSA